MRRAITRAWLALLDRYPDEELPALLSDLGGHDIECILEALEEADGVRDKPVMILAYTIKGWGLPIASDPMNHSQLLTDAQIAELRDSAGLGEGEELAPLAAESAEARAVERAVARYDARATLVREEVVPRRPFPKRWGRNFASRTSTQEAFGAIMTRLAREDALARHIVTTSPDVAVSTNLGGWINRRGVYHPEGKADFFALAAGAAAPQMGGISGRPAHRVGNLREQFNVVARRFRGLERALRGARMPHRHGVRHLHQPLPRRASLRGL